MRDLSELGRSAAPASCNRVMHGFTIVQIMIILFIVGIMGSVIVDFIIDKYCEEDPSSTLCEDMQPQLKPGLRTAADGLGTASGLQ